MHQKGENFTTIAEEFGISRQTASKYVKNRGHRDELPRSYRTREDPFKEDWEEILSFLASDRRIQAKTIFGELVKNHPGKFNPGQLRSLQRKIAVWRIEKGPDKEAFFLQKYLPGIDSQSDFTNMDQIGITIAGKLFRHKLYHFNLCYSGWESVTICQSESLESLKYGLQNALWSLGGAPQRHKTDCLSAAVRELKGGRKAFTGQYTDLLNYYRVTGQHTNPISPHENGKAERSHQTIKNDIEQALIVRNSRDFSDLSEYQKYLSAFIADKNSLRIEKFTEEKNKLQVLPETRLSDSRELLARVHKTSTINVLGNIYSVPSRLIGQRVNVRVGMDTVEVSFRNIVYAQCPRLTGKSNYWIDYRHVIDSLCKKPGAFANYKYRTDFFPTTNFQAVFDALNQYRPDRADREYLQILKCAKDYGEDLTNIALEICLKNPNRIQAEFIRQEVETLSGSGSVKIEPRIEETPLSDYDDFIREAK